MSGKPFIHSFVQEKYFQLDLRGKKDVIFRGKGYFVSLRYLGKVLSSVVFLGGFFFP